jgi:uncharacterized cupin superfamily protein
MPKIDLTRVETKSGSRYPAPHDAPCNAREWQGLGEAAGLTQFGVNTMRLGPGVWSSQRHWHTHEDEFVYMLEGEAVLVTDAGRETLRAGDCAGFPAGVPDGHHLINESDRDVVFLVVGSRNDKDGCDYPDIDMKAQPERYERTTGIFTRKDDTPI